MSRLSPEAGLAVIELHQMVVEFFEEIDLNNGLNVTRFYAADGAFFLGDFTYRGHAEISNFYAARFKRVSTELKDGTRTARHSFTNFHAKLEADGTALVKFLNTQWSAEGKPPVPGLTGPIAVVDCEMHCHRGGDGAWLIASFRGRPVFLGEDSFLNQALLKK